MVNSRNRIHDEAATGSKSGRKGLIFVMILMGVLVLAWFDGGEEAIHPITQEIELSGAD